VVIHPLHHHHPYLLHVSSLQWVQRPLYDDSCAVPIASPPLPPPHLRPLPSAAVTAINTPAASSDPIGPLPPASWPVGACSRGSTRLQHSGDRSTPLTVAALSARRSGVRRGPSLRHAG